MTKFNNIEDCIDYLAAQLEPILDVDFDVRRYADGIYSEWDNGADGDTYYVRASHCRDGIEHQVDVPSLAE